MTPIRSGCPLLMLVALIASGQPPTRAAEPSSPIVVVFSIEAKGIRLKPRSLETLNDYLATRLAATAAFQVVPREEVRRRLRAQKKASYKTCYDSTCQIELGRELAAQKSLSTRLQRIGKKCLLTANLYDLGRAATEGAATADGGCSEEALIQAIDRLVEGLRKVATPPAPIRKEPTGPEKTSGVTLIETASDAATLPVDFDPRRFDALAFLVRATALARERMADAVLIDFDVSGVYPDGQADLALSPDFRANYYFRSPANSRGDPTLPANVEQEIRCLVYVEVSARGIEVYSTLSQHNCTESPRPAWRCSLGGAWALARKEGAPQGNLVAKVSWLADGWFFDFGESSMSVADRCGE